jgi:vancomycin permeability regulator SanA
MFPMGEMFADFNAVVDVYVISRHADFMGQVVMRLHLTDITLKHFAQSLS